MTLLLALTALLGQAGQEVCYDLPPMPSVEQHPGPVEASGQGLWIGGVRFDGADMAKVRPVRMPEAERGQVGPDIDPEDVWGIDLRFSPAGIEKFRGVQKCRVGRTLEISRDGAVLSRPTLNEPIVAPSVRISLKANEAEARRFAHELRSAESRL